MNNKALSPRRRTKKNCPAGLLRSGMTVLLIFSSFSLRQKIALYLLQQSEGRSRVELKLNREAMAEYLAVPRPSLSRELMSMQKDGLLKIEKDTIIVNIDKLEDYS